MLLIDSGRLMAAPLGDRTRLDAAVDAAVAVALVADVLGDRAGVLAFDREVRRRLAPRRAGGHAVVRALLDLQPRAEDSDYELAFQTVEGAKRSLIVIFCDLLDESAAQPLADAVPVLARRHVGDRRDRPRSRPRRHHRHRADERPRDVGAQAVALDVLAARTRVAHMLRARRRAGRRGAGRRSSPPPASPPTCGRRREAARAEPPAARARSPASSTWRRARSRPRARPAATDGAGSTKPSARPGDHEPRHRPEHDLHRRSRLARAATRRASACRGSIIDQPSRSPAEQATAMQLQLEQPVREHELQQVAESAVLDREADQRADEAAVEDRHRRACRCRAGCRRRSPRTSPGCCS